MTVATFNGDMVDIRGNVEHAEQRRGWECRDVAALPIEFRQPEQIIQAQRPGKPGADDLQVVVAAAADGHTGSVPGTDLIDPDRVDR
jgi:hypothetical protein